jgi:hypothetical protein
MNALTIEAVAAWRPDPTVSFSTKDLRDRWSAMVIDALRATHPEVLS